MNTRYTLRAVALASVCLAPLAAAHAQESDFDAAPAAAAPAEAPVYDNEAEIGIRTQSATSSTFGRYNGAVDSGVFVFGDFKLAGRDSWKDGGTRYFSVVGKDLDFGEGHNELAPESSIVAKLGHQGSWGVKASYDAISYSQSTTFFSPYDRKDALVDPTQLRGVQGALNNANTNFDAPAGAINVPMGVRRDIGAVSGQYRLEGWSVTGGIKHEHKSGFMEQSGSFGQNTVFPEVIDYDIDRYDAGVAYNNRRLQAQLGYSLSDFTNNVPVSYVQYLNTNPQSYGGVGSFSQGPSSLAHAISANIAYNLTPDTRLNANFVYGLQSQNEPFAQNTTAGTVGLTPTQIGQLNGSPVSLNGLVDTYFANLAVTTRPTDGVDARLSYTLDKRADSTSRLTPGTVYGDSGNGSVGTSTSNLGGTPQSYTKQIVKLETGYRFLDSTKLSVGASYTDMVRDYSAVDHNSETAEWIKINTKFDSDLDGSLGFTHMLRVSSNVTCSNATVGNGPCAAAYGAVPEFEAGADQNTVKARVGYIPADELQIGFNGKFTNTDYKIQMGQAGMQQIYVASFGPDVSYSPMKDLSVHLFYNFETNYHDSQQRLSNGPILDNYQTTDVTHVAGIEAEYKPISVWKLLASYNFVQGDTTQYAYDGVAGVCSTSTAACTIPSISEQMQSIKLVSWYEFAPNLSWMVSYGLDYMRDNDYNYGVGGYDALAGAVVLTDVKPAYLVNSFATSVKVKW